MGVESTKDIPEHLPKRPLIVYNNNGTNAYLTALVGYIEGLPEYAGLRGFLITRDAHGLYRKFGYEVVNDRVMVKLNKGSDGTC